MKAILFFSLLVLVPSIFAQTLEQIITGWKKSTGKGYNNITADVTSISYTTKNVWISANIIPSYTIGPTWPNNPNKPKSQNKTFIFARTASAATTKTSVGLGSIGLWKDGVSIYNAYDGMTYNNQGVWRRFIF
jgi:hypothetical protein